MLRIADIITESIVDGLGVRLVVFCQGCHWHCEGCHNPGTWDFNAGTELTEDELVEEVLKRLTPLHRGITLSGGDPLDQAESVTEFLKKLKAVKPDLNVWCYTGYIYENIKDYEVLRFIDVLVDGPFVLKERDLSCAFRGSRNQRLINVRDTLASDEIKILKM